MMAVTKTRYFIAVVFGSAGAALQRSSVLARRDVRRLKFPLELT